MDSTGVPHILEHTVLCGSQKYPCRDPFFKMLNRSLSTFMNAFTGRRASGPGVRWGVSGTGRARTRTLGTEAWGPGLEEAGQDGSAGAGAVGEGTAGGCQRPVLGRGGQGRAAAGRCEGKPVRGQRMWPPADSRLPARRHGPARQLELGPELGPGAAPRAGSRAPVSCSIVAGPSPWGPPSESCPFVCSQLATTPCTRSPRKTPRTSRTCCPCTWMRPSSPACESWTSGRWAGPGVDSPPEALPLPPPVLSQAGGVAAGARGPHRPQDSPGLQGGRLQRDEGSLRECFPLCIVGQWPHSAMLARE